jgi:hypothetical protein
MAVVFGSLGKKAAQSIYTEKPFPISVIILYLASGFKPSAALGRIKTNY